MAKDNKMDIKKEVIAFVGVVFLLLGVLFGMQIMTFIFGNLGTTTSSFDPIARAVDNETGFINSTGYRLAGALNPGFASPVISIAFNGTEVIVAANISLDTSTGIITNTTNYTYPDANFTYTYTANSEATNTADKVVNDSLSAIGKYTEQSNTQFNTAAIAITLLILIAIFAIFWKIFMDGGGMMGGKAKDKNFS